MDTTVYRINQPKVIHQTIEGEVVVINLDSGTYYSLLGAGARLWNLLEPSASPAALLPVLEKEYADAPEVIRADLTTFFQQLGEEALLVPETAGANSPAPAAMVGGQKISWEKPVLQKFTDMQALLLLDPIHEVQETGWPHAKPEATS